VLTASPDIPPPLGIKKNNLSGGLASVKHRLYITLTSSPPLRITLTPPRRRPAQVDGESYQDLLRGLIGYICLQRHLQVPRRPLPQNHLPHGAIKTVGGALAVESYSWVFDRCHGREKHSFHDDDEKMKR
jgi:hypothetical protein